MNASRQLADLPAQQMLALLDDWQQRGWLRALDVALVRFLAAEVPAMSSALMLATALLSHQLGRGHVCLDLRQVLDDPYMALSLPPEQERERDNGSQLAAEQIQPVQPDELLAGLTLADWQAQLQQDELLAAAHGDRTSAAVTPLVLAGERLYLRRYWRYERQVEAAIRQRLVPSRDSVQEQQQAAAGMRDLLQLLFPAASESASRKTDWQKIACAIAARDSTGFCIITGGPGTGKTTTVVRLLALLQALELQQLQKTNDAAVPATLLRIALAAPTGKAAARLKDAIAGALDRLPAFIQDDPVLRASIPSEAITLHRLLGTRPASRRFRHDARNPLPLDVLVVDEASMVDLEMMAALLQALPPQARLILLGDKDQLASVEAGSVLGELCRRARQGHFLPATAAWITALTGEDIDADLLDAQGAALDQHIIMLRDSRRFAASSGIGQLAAAVNAGDAAGIRALWQRTDHPEQLQGSVTADIQRHLLRSLDDERLAALLLGDAAHGAAGIADYLQVVSRQRPALHAPAEAFDQWARKALQTQARFQLLCALRSGPYGVEGMNQRIEHLLARRQLIQPADPWYAGRPLLITRNDHRLGLMNGDIGICLDYPNHLHHPQERSWGRRVAFLKTDGSGDILWVLPSRLQAAETVYALTVHKSQGSEFEHCALLLPPARNPLLTRELLYTGITRAKQRFSLLCIGNAQMLEDAAQRTVQRAGGLFASDADDADD